MGFGNKAHRDYVKKSMKGYGGGDGGDTILLIIAIILIAYLLVRFG